MRNVFLSVFLILLSSSAYCGGWSTSQLMVNQFLVEGENRGYVVFSQNPFPNECGNQERYYRIDPSTARGKALISMILSVKMADKPIRPLVGGCDDLKRPILLGLSLE